MGGWERLSSGCDGKKGKESEGKERGKDNWIVGDGIAQTKPATGFEIRGAAR
jgi:hypothetical protein